MIKIICINNSGEINLSKDKVYNCEDYVWNRTDKFGYITVINENGLESVYRKTRFINIAEWGEQQIKSILDE
jgi:hypothetical protein